MKKMSAKTKPKINIHQNLSLINSLLKPSKNAYAFLRFSSFLLLVLLFFEIIIDLALEFDFTTNHLLLKLLFYISIVIPNGVQLIMPDNPKNSIYFSSFLMLALLLSSKMIPDLIIDFEFLPFCFSLLPLYSIYLFCTPKSKSRVFLVLSHQIVIVLFLNFNSPLAFNDNLKLVMSAFVNLVVFWKTSNFSFHDFSTSATENLEKTSKVEFNLTNQNGLKNLIDDIPHGIILISLQKNVLYSNDLSSELLDFDSYTISSKATIYQNLVTKFGKLEEIDFPGALEEMKLLEHGFTIIESSLTGRKSNNSHKRTFLGMNPVNIVSANVIQTKLRNLGGTILSYPIPNGNTFGGTILSREEKIPEFNNTRKVLSPKISLVEKLNDKTENYNGNYPIAKDVCLPEISLDSVLDKMIRSRQGKTIKSYYSETLDKKKKIELKIKKISFENSPAFLLTFQDVSYLKFFQQVCENNEYKNKVLTTLSHELRTPLNGALIPLEKLVNEENLDKPSEMQENLEIAYKSIMLLQNVLNNVVDFALINSNQLYLSYEEMNIYSFLDSILDLFQKQAQEKGLFLKLIFDHPKKIPKILKTDFQRLGQILVSLLTNSMKNTFEGGISLHVSLIEISNTPTSQDNYLTHCLKIVVEDTGAGIEAEKLNKIKKCLRMTDLMKVCENLNKNQGCGLGLIISQCLALLLGPPDSDGLQVNSKVANGTEFSFYFLTFQEKVENKPMDKEKVDDLRISSIKNNNNEVVEELDITKKNRESEKSLAEEFDVNYSTVSEAKIFSVDVNFLNSHILQTKQMIEITGNFSEVLIVDDDSFNLMALELILSKFKVKSVRAFNGQQALDKIQERHHNFSKSQVFSLVFMDYHMPVKDGVETTKEIMKMFKVDGLIKFPIIACTAFGARDLVEQWSNLGVSDFVIKPVSFQKVESLLRNFNIIK